MSDVHDNETPEDATEAGAGPVCGERLAAARREQQISVLEIAKELHIDEQKVRALERNDFDELGAPVFAKGHLRKYSQLVEVDEADVFTDYYKLTRSAEPPPIVVGRRSRQPRDISPGPWVAAIVVILIAAISYWWFVVEAGSIPGLGNDEAATPAVQTLPATSSAAREPAAANTAAQNPAPAASEPEPDIEANRETSVSQPAATSAPAANGDTRLTLNFSGDCWTEISDATGRRLFFNMGRAGNTIELSGVAPFAVLLGNIDNVDVRVDGNPYTVTAVEPDGRTARFTLSLP